MPDGLRSDDTHPKLTVPIGEMGAGEREALFGRHVAADLLRWHIRRRADMLAGFGEWRRVLADRFRDAEVPELERQIAALRTAPGVRQSARPKKRTGQRWKNFAC